ncbi:hypothetical protein [Acinetobacter modestus]|uniref:hypothetical protein n=1 Tax=Acinetobacter modestus TaxID=1776740 RepID=UPI00301A6326
MELSSLQIQKQIDELDERHNILLQESAKIKSQIENAKIEQKTFGFAIDDRWFTKAHQALRHKTNEQQQNRIRRGQLRQEKHLAYQREEAKKRDTFYRAYYVASSQILTPEQHMMIREIAESQKFNN